MVRRSSTWVDTILNFSVANGAEGFQNLMFGLTVDDARGWTLVRTIVDMGLSASTVAGAFGVTQCQMGIGLATEPAIAAGVGSLPDPDLPGEHPGRDWIWVGYEGVFQNGVGVDPVRMVHLDLKSRRKIDQEQLVLIIAANSIIGTTFSVAVRGRV